MSRLHDLLDRLAAAEQQLAQRRFVAPCVPGVVLRVRVEGIVQAFAPTPADFEGWGLFQPIDARRARLGERADPATIDRYLALLPRVVLIAVRPAKGAAGRAWWAMPANREAFRRRFRREGPVVVQLTDGLAPFDTIVARFDGASFWHAAIDSLADPRLADALRRAQAEWALPESVVHAGLTPEHRDAYGLALAARLRAHEWAARDDAAALELRLRRALHVGGGRFESVRTRDDGLTVGWVDRDGHHHTTFLADDASSVQSAGAICLQGRDADFDLASLVGVVTDAPDHVRFD
ncbi:MAG: hypothetical protein KF901_19025 [Myxococcales bacterium]|nr:hypothetical protein [Myxococcales bacterium]